MEIPQSKKRRPHQEGASDVATAEAKETIPASAAEEAKDTAKANAATDGGTPVRPDAAERSAKSSNSGKRGRDPQMPTRPRRRTVWQEDDEDGGLVLTDVPECDGGEKAAFEIPTCVLYANLNLMTAGAMQRTGLNSDEDPELSDEPEDEEEVDDDSWDDNWNIGYLTDEESDEEPGEIPDSM
ncbi:hypothetical protein PC116_g1266 [Phytophthora cactorum]|nr:hypothetical protein PC116_g1266 [Phytophthora cactorum]